MNLSDLYLRCVYAPPPELRVRRDLEREAVRQLAMGRHLCIRGFWRIGKTVLMRAALAGICERQRASGFFLDLAEPASGAPTPATRAEFLEVIAEQIRRFALDVGREDLEVRGDRPLDCLAELEGPTYVGLDELIAMRALGEEPMSELLSMLLDCPDAVRLILVCHRYVDADPIFEALVVDHDRFETIFVPPLELDELRHIVQTPAQTYGVEFTPDAVELLAELTGRKPFETFIYCALATQNLKGERRVDAERLAAEITFDRLLAEDLGQWILDTYIRIYMRATTDAERAAIDAMVDDGAPDAESAASLERAGWTRRVGGQWEINGWMFAEVVRRIRSGDLRVTFSS